MDSRISGSMAVAASQLAVESKRLVLSINRLPLLVLRSRASGVSKDEADIGASWFETARIGGSSSAYLARAPAHHEGLPQAGGHQKIRPATLISRLCPEKGQNSDLFGHNPARR